MFDAKKVALLTQKVVFMFYEMDPWSYWIFFHTNVTIVQRQIKRLFKSQKKVQLGPD